MLTGFTHFTFSILGITYLILKGNPTDIFENDWCYIRMVGVNPNYTGKGIGKKLTQICIDFAKEKDQQFIALHTAEFMISAKHRDFRI